MNFGIIGFGNIARKFAASLTYTTTGKLYAIGSRSLEEKDPFVTEHPEVKRYNSYEKLLDDEGLEAVYIALPHMYHKEWTLQALQRQIPVLCEKPAVLSFADMLEIKAAVHTHQTYFLEAFKSKFNVGMDRLKEDLHQIGRLKRLEASFCSDAVRRVRQDSFLLDPVQGGALNDVGPYVIGFALDVIGEQICEIKSRIKVVNGIEHYVEMQLEFEHGAKACLECAIDRKKERKAHLIGKEGTIEIPLYNRIMGYTIRLNNGMQLERQLPIHGDDMVMEIQALIDDVRQQRLWNQRHTLDDSCAILRVMELVRKAARRE